MRCKLRNVVEHFALPLILVLFILIAVGLNVIVPLGEAPDEVSHWAYAQYLATHWQLPPSKGAVSGESHQPPLYYWLAAITTAWIPQGDFQVMANPDFDLNDPQTPNLLLHTRQEAFPYQGDALAWHLMRLLSTTMGVITIWATWQLAREMFPEQKWLVIGATAFVAFLPAFVVISAAVNNDNLIVMLSSLSILQVVRIIRYRRHSRDILVLGILLGLGALTKLSGLVVWLFTAIILTGHALIRRKWKDTTLDFVLGFGIALAILAPWCIRNLQEYGDPFGWSNILLVTPVRQTPMTMDDWVSSLRGLYTSFWGRFGGALHLHMSDSVYVFMSLTIVIALVGWIGYARDALRQKLATNMQIVFILFTLFWALMLGAHVRWVLTVLGADQARQLFPGLPLLAIFLAAGWAHLARQCEKIYFVILSGGLCVLSIASFWYIVTIYSPPLQNLATLPRLGGTNAPSDFGKAIRVLDYRFEPQRIMPGESLSVQIQWQALDNLQENYALLLQLTDGNRVVANKDGIPSAGRLTTDWWRKDQILASRHIIIIPDDTMPGTYILRLGLHAYNRWEWLPVRGQDVLTLGSIQVEPQ